MTEQEILGAIEIILYNAGYSNKLHGLRFYSTIRDEFSFHHEFYNERVGLLLDLHQKLVTDKEKDLLFKHLDPKIRFPLFLPNQAKAARLVNTYQDFVFVFLIKIKEIDKALKMISNRVFISVTKVNLFHALSEILAVEPIIFDNIKLDEVLSIINSYEIFINNLQKYWVKEGYSLDGKNYTPSYDVTKKADYDASDRPRVHESEQLLRSIKDRVYEIKKERLSSFLQEGINYEINQDQKELQNIITEFGFNRELNEAILKINEKLYKAKDPFEFKSCIDLIRTLLEKLCISVALEIEKKKQIPPPESPIDRMLKARNYFNYHKISFLSQKEDALIEKSYAFLSEEGAHALQSEREYARISRNLVIEIGLFLVEKLKKYLS